MDKFNNILLFGGETKNENMPVGFYSSLAMLPLRGKPVIWWQLENLKNNGLEDFIIVVCNDNKKLAEYVNNVLKETFNIKLVSVSNRKNILSSLKYGLQKADQNLPTRVILGDTLIPNSINDDVDTLFSSRHFTSSKEWCLIEKENDNNISYYYDKQEIKDVGNKEALVGYYAFSDTKELLNCCIKSRLMLKKEISTALIEYQKKYPLKYKSIEDWYDLGHTSGLIKVKNLLFSARCFNSIFVDTDMGTLTKSSTKIQKLEDEAYWFNNLPEELKILTPRFILFEKVENISTLTQELYGYPSLQELYLSEEVNIEDWRYIIEKLFSLHKNFEKYTKEDNCSSLKWLYVEKTKERLEELKSQNCYWKDLLSKEYEYINGVKYLGFKLLEKDLIEYAQTISDKHNLEIMHGDYCFSNILFDSSNYTFKLIDPRGRLNSEPTIYGDSRYDIAKLRHSVVGLYDFIVQGLFNLEETNFGYRYKFLNNKDYSILEIIFDEYANQNGFNVSDIKFIEGLLFLTMLPLHKENFTRQKMLYIRAIELLNSSLNEYKKRNIKGEQEIANMY